MPPRRPRRAGPGLRRLRARARQANVPIEIIQTTAEALPFPDESFDHVVSSIALCSVSNLETTLAEIHRVLRPDGTLDLPRARLRARTDRPLAGPAHTRPAPPRDGCHLNRNTVAAIERAGFQLAEIEEFTMPPGHPLIKPAVQGAAIKATTDDLYDRASLATGHVSR